MGARGNAQTKMAGPAGLEPATFGFVDRRSDPTELRADFGAANEIRTRVLRVKGGCPGPLDDGGKKAILVCALRLFLFVFLLFF
jgi:hypothetical protein